MTLKCRENQNGYLLYDTILLLSISGYITKVIGYLGVSKLLRTKVLDCKNTFRRKKFQKSTPIFEKSEKIPHS